MSTYRDAGVDLDAADEIVGRISDAVTRTWHEGVVGGFGGFAAGLSIPDGYRRPILMMSTDGVGTKAELARRWDVLDGIGQDLVAMCGDDLVAAGARPFAMTDYLAVGRLDVPRAARIIGSVAAACEQMGVALLGGETAEHPGLLGDDQFDIAGTALGLVEQGAEIDGSGIRAGDAIVGIASTNLRSNGFSLVRSVVEGAIDPMIEIPGTGRPLMETLLDPSVLYAPVVLPMLDEVAVHGLAHITGGGLPGNTTRILPSGLDAVIDAGSWPRPPVFPWLSARGEIPEEEMFRTFNMGIGFLVVVEPADADRIIDLAGSSGLGAWVVGRVVPGAGDVVIS